MNHTQYLLSRTAENVKKLRTQKGLTLNQLSEHTGIPKKYLQELENGQCGEITLLELNTLCRFFELSSVNDFFNWD